MKLFLQSIILKTYQNFKLGSLYNAFFSDESLKKIEFYIILLAIALFFGNVLAIITDSLGFTSFFNGSNPNFLRAISIPFTIILFYEVFLLIKSLSVSIVDSVGEQLKVVALIMIRNVFKDISELGDIDVVSITDQAVSYLFTDILATITVFALVGIYYYTKNKAIKPVDLSIDNTFCVIRKCTSLFAVLTIAIILPMSFFVNGDYSGSLFDSSQLSFFFETLFLILILLDVFLLTVSTLFDDYFETIVRDSALVISTILIRVGLSLDGYLTNVFIITGITFGIGIFFIYYKTKKVYMENRGIFVKE